MKLQNKTCISRQFFLAFAWFLITSLNYQSLHLFSSTSRSNFKTNLFPDFPCSQEYPQYGNQFIKLLEINPDSAQSTALALFNQNPTNKLSAYFASNFYQSGVFTHAVYWTEKLYIQIPDSSVYEALLIIIKQAGLQSIQTGHWAEAARYFEKSASYQPLEPEHYTSAAAAWINAGKNMEALSCLEKGFTVLPDNTDIRSMLKQIYFHQKEYSEFETLLKKHLSQHPEDIAAQIDLSQTLIAAGRGVEGLKKLEKLRDQYSDSPIILDTLAKLYHQSMHFESERRIYRDWLNYDRSRDSLYLKMAESYEIENNWKSARKCYQKYIQKHSNDIDILFKIAETYMHESCPDSSLFIYKKILIKSPSNTMALKQAGQTSESLNHPDSALKFYEEWEKIDAKSPAPLIAQAEILEKTGQHTIAFRKYLQAEKLGGNAFSAYGLFKSYVRENNSVKTEEYFKIGFKRSVHEIAESENRIQRQFIQKYTSEEQVNSQLINSKSQLEYLKNTMTELFRYGLVHYPVTLEKIMNSLFTEYPNSPLLMEFLGDYYSLKKYFAKAEAYYKKVFEYNPREIHNQIKLIQVLEQSGKYDEAFRLCRASVEHNPDNVTSIRLCIDIAEKSGNLEVLADRWEQLCQSHSDYSTLKQYLISVWHKLGRNDKVLMLLDEQS